MGADADNSTLVHDDDAIGVEDRTDALGNDDHGRLSQLALERGTQTGIRAKVESAEAVVEDIDRCTLDEGPGYRKSLSLTARYVRPALFDGELMPSASSSTNSFA